MIKRSLIFNIFLILKVFLVLAYSQQRFFFKHYSTEDGLSENTVMDIMQDHKGNLWFATWDGINCFDGYSFNVFKAHQGSDISLTNNRVDQIKEDRYGYIWLLTYDNRAHRFDPRTVTSVQVPAAGQPGSLSNVKEIKVLPDGNVWLLTEDDGAIKIITDPKHNYQVKAEVYSAKSGLFPAHNVYDIHQDQKGNEWMLSDNGLGMFPCGKTRPKEYFVEPTQNSKSNQIFYAVEENKKEICFGSNNGRVWRYQKADGKFFLLKLPTIAQITSIHTVRCGKIVITTNTDGFFLYEPVTGNLAHYTAANCNALSSAPIISSYVDRTSEVWFEQKIPGEVSHFNPVTGVVKRESIEIEHTSIDRSRPSFNIHEDKNGYLWVHPYGGGFSYYDRKQQKLVPFYDQMGSKNWKFSNKIHAAFSDKQGNLWLCTHSEGLEKVSVRTVPFSMLTPESLNYESLSNEVRAICENRYHQLLIGTKDGMVRMYDDNKKYLGYLNESGDISMRGTPLNGVAYTIIQDSEGVVWIGTKGDGLVRAQPISSDGLHYRLVRYKHNQNDIYSLNDNEVYCVYEDHRQRIWVATFAGGISYMSKDKAGHTIFINSRNELEGYPINLCYKARFITSDHQGRIWVGTTAGALMFNENFKNPKDIKFIHFCRVPNDQMSLSNNDVHWIIATKKGDIFLATFGGGLNKFLSVNKDGQGKFETYSKENGLPSDVLLSIREDHHHILWISSENGICKFDPSKKTFENYDRHTITFPVRFSEAASFLDSKGTLLFGASNGILMFNPDSIRKSHYVPRIVFSKFLLANQEVLPGKNSVLKVDLDDVNKLELTHNENIFTIQYAALDYINPKNVQYKYKLEGFEKQWTFADKVRSVTYTNLPKGHYVFKVYSTNSDGYWTNNVRSLPIVILPSFWETPLAYVFYALSIIFIIFIVSYILFTIYKLKREVSVEQEVSDIKLKFFTNVSHELRTPLTLIVGPVEYVLGHTKLPDEAHEQLVVVERNANRMLRLVNQILDFRKIQNNKMKLQVQRVHIIPFIRKVMSNFESVAKEHHIDFLFQTEKENLFLWVDVDKLEKIIFNLLSNAFKYTPDGKMISVFVIEDEHTISIGVQDQGIGISDAGKKSLFVRFENFVDKNLFSQQSTGIGLSLVKDLVEMHKGTITVDSKLGEGSCFKVNFLKGKDHYDNSVELILDDTDTPTFAEQVVDQENLTDSLVETNDEVSEVDNNNEDGCEDSISDKEGKTKNVMLIVEDNRDLRCFLRTVFCPFYRVVEAVNGFEGLNRALKYIPDIIISDVMMPEIDGIEMTKKLRLDVTTSHIPIVLLTAKTTIESKLEGLELGADDYITKPFSATYLKARVENILVQRKKLQKLYRDQLMKNIGGISEIAIDASAMQSTSTEPLTMTMSAKDKKFLDDLAVIMEKKMDNGNLVVDDLVSELAVSRSVFFKKLKMLTGLAPIEFIKEMRMKRAAQLIAESDYNMTQIAYMVGINDPRYFSKCFKVLMGVTPTEFRKNNHH
ncbi:MAG: two-component regulator propeller domain-containing protein [Bacteroidaceae bacterium]